MKEIKTRNVSLQLKDLCILLRVPDARHHAAKILLMFLGGVTNNSGASWYSLKNIRNATGLGRTTILDATGYLMSLGWLRCESGSCAKSNKYYLQQAELVKALEAQKLFDAEGEVVLPQDQGSPVTDSLRGGEGSPVTDKGSPVTDWGSPVTDKGSPATGPELSIEATVQRTTGQKATVQKHPAPEFLEGGKGKESETIENPPKGCGSCGPSDSVHRNSERERLKQEIALFDGKPRRRLDDDRVIYLAGFERQLRELEELV